MSPNRTALHDEILNRIHPAAAPAGAATFPLPALSPAAVLPLVEAATSMALASLATNFGGAAEDYVESHRDAILAVVPDAVLALAQKIATDLRTPAS